LNDLTQLVQACLASGVVFSALCAMIVVPPLLWLAIRRLAPLIVSMDQDPLWQAPLAALAASLPGVTFAALAIEAFVTAPGSNCLSFVSGRIIFGSIIVLASGAMLRAALLTWRRHAEVRRLFALSQPPSSRVAALAREFGLPIRTLAWPDQFCAIAGVLRPSMFISDQTEARLDDDELRAAALHERAHRDRGDQWLIAILMFATSLIPLPAADLIATYRRARELAADRAVRGHVSDLHLASAILRLSGSTAPPYVAGLASDPDAIGVRLDALLRERSPLPSGRVRYMVAISLGLLVSLAVSSLVANIVVAAACSRMGIMS
jgi:Zn-dependent protease with chaperone function